MEERCRIAVFIDFDNIEIGVKNTLGRDFDVSAVLEALKERGEILTKIAYGDWTRHGNMSRSLSQHGVQMVQRHPGPRGDKNGADINLALDALEMALTKPHIDAFAIVSGDSDFISLVEKLKQYNKSIYIVGGRAFTSTILQKNCREFISYESLLTPPSQPSRQQRGPQRAAAKPAGPVLPLSHAAPLLYRALEVMTRREVKPQLGLLKSTMLQLDSSFTERDYGASSFRQFVENMKNAGLVNLKRVDGQFIVEAPHGEGTEGPPPAVEQLLREEDALPILYKALKVIDENDLWGMLDYNSVKDYVKRLEPDFDERKYGFAQFAELLNFAQDLGLVRLEPGPDSIWRVYPGVQFSANRPVLSAVHKRATRKAPAEAAQSTEANPPAAEMESAPVEPGAPPLDGMAQAVGMENPESEPVSPDSGGAAPQPAEEKKAARRRVYRRSRKRTTPSSHGGSPLRSH